MNPGISRFSSCYFFFSPKKFRTLTSWVSSNWEDLEKSRIPAVKATFKESYPSLPFFLAQIRKSKIRWRACSVEAGLDSSAHFMRSSEYTSATKCVVLRHTTAHRWQSLRDSLVSWVAALGTVWQLTVTWSTGDNPFWWLMLPQAGPVAALGRELGVPHTVPVRREHRIELANWTELQNLALSTELYLDPSCTKVRSHIVTFSPR